LGDNWSNNPPEDEAAQKGKATAPTAAPRISDKKKIALLTRELSESLERETATSQVLGIMSSSPSDLQPVFETILANATRLCEASYGTLWLCEGDTLRAVALHGALPDAFAAWLRHRTLSRPDPGHVGARAATSGHTVHIPDVRAWQPYQDRNPSAVAGVELRGVRTVIAVPMLMLNEVAGVISIYRQEVRPAVARKLAVILHRMWIDGTEFNWSKKEAAA